MSEYAKNIQTIEDMWKKRIELRREGYSEILRNTPKRGGRMTEYIIDMSSSSYQSESGLLCADVSQLREEIVRCRDCEHYKPYRTHRYGMMNRCHDEQGHTHRRDESDFCSRGERRSE